jgi:ferric-dicitrate binding protein FerR (iron transport regulator)
MQIDEIRALLEKYQKGLCTAEERKTIDEWYDSLRLEDERLRGDEVGNSLEKIRGNLQELTRGQLARPGLTSHEPSTPVIHPYRWRQPIWMAAGAAIAAVVFVSAWLLFHQQAPVPPALANLHNGDTTVTTNRGETKQIVLPDGSTIELNAGTEFRYPKKFSGSARAVALVKGEAFFQVTSDPARPFTVATGKWRTTVLGTSFDIRAYGQDQATQIALLTGKVKVSGEKESVLLLPRQLIRIDKTTGKIQTEPFVNDYEVAAWKEGAMHFKDASFADLTFGIGNKYNVALINKSNKQRWSYTGLFRNESLQEVVETICQTENLGYRFTDDGIVIINKN